MHENDKKQKRSSTRSPTAAEAYAMQQQQASPRSPMANTPRSPNTPRSNKSRIDSSAMPRPSSGKADIFYKTQSEHTGRRNPPPTNSIFTAVDTGNCSPRYMRSTYVAPPQSSEVMATCGVPFVVIATPFAHPENAELPIPVVRYPYFGDAPVVSKFALHHQNQLGSGESSNSLAIQRSQSFNLFPSATNSPSPKTKSNSFFSFIQKVNLL
jgi:hypothetical protein